MGERRWQRVTRGHFPFMLSLIPNQTHEIHDSLILSSEDRIELPARLASSY